MEEEMNLETLPEEIRSHILSLMPTKFAVQTSILSKCWRYTWTMVTNLDLHLDFDYHDLDSFIQFVSRVFKSYKKTSKLNLFRLRCCCCCCFRVQNPNVSNWWIDEAVTLNVRELDICTNLPHEDLPLSLFTCTTLTMLRLDYHHVDWDWECPSRVFLPCLKTLDVIVYSNPFVNAFKLIPGCPVLETLSLQVDSCTKREQHHYIFNIPTLKRFTLIITNRVPVFHKVVLRLPVLQYLCVGGWLSSFFVMEDLPPLVEASILSKSASSSHLWLQLLKGLSGVKSLSLQHVIFDRCLPIFPNMEQLEFKLYWDQGIVPQFLERCPKLKHLCLGSKFTGCIWKEPKVVPSCIRTNLTTLNYLSCKGTVRYDMKFLKYMLGNAEVLKTVTVTCEHLSLEEEMQLDTELLKFPRASMDCAIKSGSSWFDLLK